MKISLAGHSFSDELMVRFYACPECAFTHVPYGLSAWSSGADATDVERETEIDARYCPGCGQAVEWVDRAE